ncbi:phospholipase A1-Ibeta2, chloroplastic-like [Typha angustifolia]|uniref:phospholipase A1-Ibeta2, chloroplastic-like n=1 Tax=Typha angustifolia TaxID=59011 RepID=UPI003C2E05CD
MHNAHTSISLPVRSISPLNPLSLFPYSRCVATTSTTNANRTHLSNLERLFQKRAESPPAQTLDRGKADPGHPLFSPLNLPFLLLSSRNQATEEMSPRSLTRLQRLLSDSNRPSPRAAIANRWRLYHGSADWAGLLDPLDHHLRRELIRYGELVQAAYVAFDSHPSPPRDGSHHIALPDQTYRVVSSLFATSSLKPPHWAGKAAPWMTQRSSWIGYIAVCESEREIKRIGRRDIVIVLRGTATCLEWVENFRAGLTPMADGKKEEEAAKVEHGFWSLFKTAGDHVPSLSSAVAEEVERLLEKYEGEELSITVTGHSLGAALALLVADKVSSCSPQMPPIAVFSFGGPRVGNRGLAERVKGRGVKVLRVVNAHDVVTRVPGVLPRKDGYTHVGMELRLDSRVSPYLRPDADPACCHDLEAYLHLVDGFLGSNCPFRSNAKRSLVRLLSQQGSNVKKLYTSKARALQVGTTLSTDHGCIAR